MKCLKYITLVFAGAVLSGGVPADESTVGTLVALAVLWIVLGRKANKARTTSGRPGSRADRRRGITVWRAPILPIQMPSLMDPFETFYERSPGSYMYDATDPLFQGDRR